MRRSRWGDIVSERRGERRARVYRMFVSRCKVSEKTRVTTHRYYLYSYFKKQFNPPPSQIVFIIRLCCQYIPIETHMRHTDIRYRS